MNIKISILSPAVVAVALIMAPVLSGCQDSYNEPELVIPEATWQSNTTIADFKAEFGNEMAVKIPYKDEDQKIPYILHGRVISSDASGNIYKSITIQDESGAVAFSVNQGSTYLDYRVGQEILFNASDRWFGQYSDYLQFGELGEYHGNPQITFMSWDLFNASTQLSGLPNQDFTNIRLGAHAPTDHPYRVLATISELNSIPASDPLFQNMMGQLVEIPNVSFVDAGKNPPVTFSTYQNSEDRYIQDSEGNQLNVRCSGYSSFYNAPLPEGVGTIRGILSVYQGNWQLLLRTIEDVIFVKAGSSKADPMGVEDAIALDNNMRRLWVEGYIIGSLKAGLTDGVTTIEDIITDGPATETDNNLIIAPSAECRDLDKMMLVVLPAGSMIRQYGNLLDNPQFIGHKILVEGQLNEVEGMHGLTGLGMRASSFEIEGLDISGFTEYGSGTEINPYSPLFVINNHEEQNYVWIEGYIVGFVVGTSADTGAYFTTDTNVADFGGNNFLLGVKKESDSLTQAIPVNTTGSSYRRDYNLKTNPDKFYKKVLIKGDIRETFGSWGIINITEIKEQE